MRTRVLGIAACLNLLLGCGVRLHDQPAPAAASSASVAPVIARILKAGELRIGTTGDQPPLSVQTSKGTFIGLEPEIGNAMAAGMGVKARFVKLQFPDLIPALERGDIDMAMAGLTITPDRNLRVAFVGPYLTSGKTVLARSDRIAQLKSKKLSLQDAKLVVAALRNSTSQQFVEQNLPKATLRLVSTYDEGVQLVVDRQVDALVADYPAAVLADLKHPDVSIEVADEPLTFEPLGIALSANDPLLVNWTENFLDMLDGSGQLDDMSERWFHQGTWLEETL